MKKLTEKQVDKLYKDYPEIEDANYNPKETISVDDNDVATIDMAIGNKKYRVLSNPTTTEDIWYIKDKGEK